MAMVLDSWVWGLLNAIRPVDDLLGWLRYNVTVNIIICMRSFIGILEGEGDLMVFAAKIIKKWIFRPSPSRFCLILVTSIVGCPGNGPW